MTKRALKLTSIIICVYLKTRSFDWFLCLVIHPRKLLMTVEKQPSEHVYPVKNVSPNVFFPAKWATEKARPFFPLNRCWLIGILVSWLIKSPYITGDCLSSPTYTLNNWFHSIEILIVFWGIRGPIMTHPCMQKKNLPETNSKSTWRRVSFKDFPYFQERLLLVLGRAI